MFPEGEKSEEEGNGPKGTRWQGGRGTWGTMQTQTKAEHKPAQAAGSSSYDDDDELNVN